MQHRQAQRLFQEVIMAKRIGRRQASDGYPVGRVRRTKPARPGNDGVRLYTLQVFLTGGPVTEEFYDKEVSRKIQIRGDQTLEDLHYAIFDAFDREEEHLYEFNFGKGPDDPRGPFYGMPEESEILAGEHRVRDARAATLDSLGLKQDRAFGYVFDFGDNWEHQINVLVIEVAPDEGEFPRVIERINASPAQYPDLDEE